MNFAVAIVSTYFPKRKIYINSFVIVFFLRFRFIQIAKIEPLYNFLGTAKLELTVYIGTFRNGISFPIREA